MSKLTHGHKCHVNQNYKSKEPCVFSCPRFVVKLLTFLLVNENNLVKSNLFKSYDFLHNDSSSQHHILTKFKNKSNIDQDFMFMQSKDYN